MFKSKYKYTGSNYFEYNNVSKIKSYLIQLFLGQLLM